MRYTDFIWDYDGTLFDTYDAVCRSYMRAVRDKGIDISWEELRWMSKHSLGWAAQQLEERYHVPANELLALRAHYADEEETMETMRPYPGTAEVLAAICANGGRNYLYSHRDKRSIEALEFYGLRQYFTDFITKDEEIAHVIKDNYVYIHVNVPKKDRDLELMKRLGNPGRFGYPVFVILDEKGNVLHIQNSSYLEEGTSYDRKKVLEFFIAWTKKSIENIR